MTGVASISVCKVSFKSKSKELKIQATLEAAKYTV
jgi:hypothetical protein